MSCARSSKHRRQMEQEWGWNEGMGHRHHITEVGKYENLVAGGRRGAGIGWESEAHDTEVSSLSG